jgi:threonylcarbamoyladenosine tRNA methylthiotransferase MtaB
VPSSFYIENFGCRAARADGEALADRLRAAGCCEDKAAVAEVVIVNTCSVTAEADRAARAFIRRAHRLNPEARIVATGCYAQRAPHELAEMRGVAAVVGNSHKALAPEIALGVVRGFDRVNPSAAMVSVASLFAGNEVPVLADERFAHSFLEDAQVVPGVQTRPNLKIQEGCGNRCSFCVIPQTRGGSRSLAAEAVLRQIRDFVAAGGNELVLSGINLGRWGRDLSSAARGELIPTHPAEERRMDGAPTAEDGAAPPRTLAGLARRIFAETQLPRLRLSSIEPMDWDGEMIALVAEFGGSRLARHVHLPLQSGSDAVLRRMHRRYRPWHYAEKVAALVRAAGPELTVGADVMVGFPGETDSEFEETMGFIRALPFGYLHLFPFSPRPGTRAWSLHQEKPVKPRIVDERTRALRALAEEKSRLHRARFVGRELDAITLHTGDSVATQGRTSALTENFLPVELEGKYPANSLVRVLVSGISSGGELLGREAVVATGAR